MGPIDEIAWCNDSRTGPFSQYNPLLFYPKVALTNPKSLAPPLVTLLRRYSSATQEMIGEIAKHGLDR